MSVSELTLERVRQAMRGLRPPTAYDKVYNDECVFSFDTPLSPGGLYVSLRSFLGFGAQHVQADSLRTGDALYLHLQLKRVLKPKGEQAEGAPPTKMAIGVEGGFQVDEAQYDEVKETALVLMPDGERIPLPCDELPTLVSQCASAVLTHTGANAEAKEAAVAWEAEVKPSKYAEELIQLPAHKTISPDSSTWICEESGMTENLWLNLSDGHIGSGRRQWDGSGGSNGALDHYRETKENFPPTGFPLVVKLGTITPHGADVYSYADDEDTEVTDPKLAEHLAHWGIDIMKMEKTVESVSEMNIRANEKLELDKITEAGKSLRPILAQGYLGLNNLGNSCYINSVLQILFAVPEFSVLSSAAASIFASAPSDPTADLLTQLAKLATALLGSRYIPGGDGAEPTPDGEAATDAAVPPRMLKVLLGRSHQEFSSARQQDAFEYFQHFLESLARAERAGAARIGEGFKSLAGLFGFALEERYEVSGRVAYKKVPSQRSISLQIPIELASNQAEVAAYREIEDKRQRLGDPTPADAPEPVVPLVPFSTCLERYFAAEPLESFRGQKNAIKTTRFATFPKMLVVHLRRYYVDTDWVAKKIVASVPVPEVLDLEAHRSTGMLPGEEALPEEAAEAEVPAAPIAAAPTPDDAIVAQLVSMGFSENGSKRAALAVSNSSAEAATEWVFAHMEDADFNEPLPPPGAAATTSHGSSGGADPEAVAMLGAMGFSERHAMGALAATGGSIERAADWLFSHSDDLESAVAATLGEVANVKAGDGSCETEGDDGPGIYDLLGFVSHMGSNTSCGHYVCHIKKEGRWVLHNDRKVAASEATPLDLGYMYFFRRRDA